MSQSIIEILQDADVQFDQKEKENIYIECPECGENKLSVNVFTGAWHCWLVGCRLEHGSAEFSDLSKIMKLGKPDFVPTKAPTKNKRITEAEKKIIISAAQNKTEVIDWANSRCLDPKPLMKWGVGYWKEKRCITIPFRDHKTGKLIGARCRGENGSQWLIGKEPPLFIIDPKDIKKNKCVIVEGEPDVFTIKQFGIPVVGVLGAGKVGGLALLKQVKHPYLGFDMDGAGEDGVEKALLELGQYRCKRIHWTHKDPNDMLKADPDGFRDSLAKCLREAKTPEIDLVSKSADESVDDYLEMKKVKQVNMRWGYPRLDACTKGIHSGWTIYMMMEGGVGKTTFLLNVLVNNVLDGVKCGIASFEEHPDAEIIPKLVSMFIERNPGGGDFDKKEIEYAKKDLCNVKIYPDDDVDIVKFQNWVRECYYVHGVRFIVADYLQMIVSEESVGDMRRDCYRVGKDLVKEMPELTIMWAVQPKQLLAHMDKKSGDKKRAKLTMNDARGGTPIQQSCDVFLIGVAVEGQSDITQYEFEKVRGQLAVSKKDWLFKIEQLEYDHSTMRQWEVKNLVFGG